MNTMQIERINKVVSDYFASHASVDKIPAKDLMEEFIAAGIFKADHKNGLPIRDLLRELDDLGRLSELPNVEPERKVKNTYWYFVRR